MLLSILIPSNRSLKGSAYSLFAALSVNHPDVEVVVSDNSGDPKKEAFMESMKPSSFRILKGPTDAFDNFRCSIESSTGRYVMFIGDDDQVMPAGIRFLAEQLKYHDPMLFAGTYLREGFDYYKDIEFSLLESRSIESRVEGLGKINANGNPGFSLIAPRDLALRSFDLASKCPYSASWDMIYVLLLCIVAKVKYFPVPYFVYRAVNWHTIEAVEESRHRLAKARQISSDYAQISRLCIGLEGFFLGLKMANEFGVHPREAHNAAYIWLAGYFNAWKVHWYRSVGSEPMRRFMSEKAIDTLEKLADCAIVKPEYLLDLVSDIMDFSGMSSTAYREYLL